MKVHPQAFDDSVILDVNLLEHVERITVAVVAFSTELSTFDTNHSFEIVIGDRVAPADAERFRGYLQRGSGLLALILGEVNAPNDAVNQIHVKAKTAADLFSALMLFDIGSQ